MSVTQYLHHGAYVSVQSDLKGKHREHCLCHKCGCFIPDNHDKNCRIANLLFELDRAFGLVTPVYECPMFIKKPEEVK